MSSTPLRALVRDLLVLTVAVTALPAIAGFLWRVVIHCWGVGYNFL